MRTIIVFALVLGPPAIGADFRGTEFGSSCADVEARERTLGSRPVPVDSTNGGAYRFNGRVSDREVSITYLCNDGKLALGDYHFPAGTYDDAVADFLAAYSSLLSLYGAPSLAYAQHGDSSAQVAVPSVGAAIRDEYHASWVTKNAVIHVDLISHGDYAGDNWHAMVVTSPAGK